MRTRRHPGKPTRREGPRRGRAPRPGPAFSAVSCPHASLTTHGLGHAASPPSPERGNVPGLSATPPAFRQGQSLTRGHVPGTARSRHPRGPPAGPRRPLAGPVSPAIRQQILRPCPFLTMVTLSMYFSQTSRALKQWSVRCLQQGPQELALEVVCPARRATPRQQQGLRLPHPRPGRRRPGSASPDRPPWAAGQRSPARRLGSLGDGQGRPGRLPGGGGRQRRKRASPGASRLDPASPWGQGYQQGCPGRQEGGKRSPKEGRGGVSLAGCSGTCWISGRQCRHPEAELTQEAAGSWPPRC